MFGKWLAEPSVIFVLFGLKSKNGSALSNVELALLFTYLALLSGNYFIEMERECAMLEREKSYLPYSCQDFDVKLLSSDLPPAVTIAKLWNAYIPRGKGWFPRLMGRFFRKSVANHYIKTKEGACLVIEPSSLDVYVHMLNHENAWCEHIFAICRSYLSNGGVFYDIGANVGYVSLEVAKVFGDKVSVVAFEPQAQLAHSIALSARLNGFDDLKVFDLMLGDAQGQKELFVGSHSIHASAIPREGDSFRVLRDMATLDVMVKSGIIPPPTVIKLDVEGGEFSVLSGAIETISSYLPHIIFESDRNMERFGYSRIHILELIRSMGPYQFFMIADTNGKVVPLADEVTLGDIDIVAIPTEI